MDHKLKLYRCAQGQRCTCLTKFTNAKSPKKACQFFTCQVWLIRPDSLCRSLCSLSHQAPCPWPLITHSLTPGALKPCIAVVNAQFLIIYLGMRYDQWGITLITLFLIASRSCKKNVFKLSEWRNKRELKERIKAELELERIGTNDLGHREWN